jgi:xylulose-5-phosphate/fructose-6-phosphate phosphoketolase
MFVTSTVWRQDHNGFTHQDPGFIDVAVNKSAEVTRIYLPPDVNCLLSVANHCLKSENYVNVIVCDKQLHLQYMDMDAAIAHCTKGIGIWEWACTDEGSELDVVMEWLQPHEVLVKCLLRGRRRFHFHRPQSKAAEAA